MKDVHIIDGQNVSWVNVTRVQAYDKENKVILISGLFIKVPQKIIDKLEKYLNE